ncbi:MAG TPA: PEP-utilizing enzyme [Dehalococcoidia bacterium]|nr:PEP-utilizing enzyme [Dehalococcoidia bacterium]
MTTTEDRLCEWDALPNPDYNLWTIGNSSEVVPGISTPFISTTGAHFEAESLRLVVDQLGIADQVRVHDPPIGNWAAVIGGRWALNLALFNAMLSTWQVEGASGVMEQFITSTEGRDISAAAASDPALARRVLARVRRLRGQLERAVEGDRLWVEEVRARERARDFSRMSLRQLWDHILRLRRVCSRLLARHLHVSTAAGDYADRLNKFLDAALPGHDPALVIILTSALRDVESAAPAKGAWDVAKLVASRERLAAEVRKLSPHEIAERLRSPSDDDWAAFADSFAAFIQRFGFRGMGEVDPAFADWEEEPAFALSTIKTFLDAPPDKDPYAREAAAAAFREATEAQVLSAVPRGMRSQYRELLAGAQKFTRLREASKANWVRGDRTLRRPTLEIGRRLVSAGLIEAADDVFWLVESEVAEAINGRLAREHSLSVVPRRKAEAKRLADVDLPEVFELPVKAERKTGAAAQGNVLRGLPVSAGKASGRARIVLSTESACEVKMAPGEVLVAPFTDAPWTPLFVAAAAVVVETGGILSHAATVAREYGIPAVVAVKDATSLIREGQLVTVDGMTGEVVLG